MTNDAKDDCNNDLNFEDNQLSVSNKYPVNKQIVKMLSESIEDYVIKKL